MDDHTEEAKEVEEQARLPVSHYDIRSLSLHCH